MDRRSAELEAHLASPRGRGRLAEWPHAGAAGGGACGDLVRIAVRAEGDTIVEAGFDAHGCATARAAGSAAVELLEGAKLLDAARIAADDICHALGALGPSGRHAADLAADALHRALGHAAAHGTVAHAPRENRTLVAMSGGVDSAVAARLAQEAGHHVVAVTLELWADPAADGTASCCSPQAVTGARALAQRMGLPHLTLDMRAPFREQVVDDFVSEHAAGATPNPCVRCNGLVRFDAMLDLAGRLGAARLATGHYARIARDERGPLVRAAVDEAKDQSYMLARLAPGLLDRLWFPLGELTKPEVRELARAAELPVADKPESQDLCFLAGIGHEPFLRRHLPEREGEIVDGGGRVLGRHRGQERFTVGQRRGLGLGAPVPLFVLHKDAGSARVTVGPHRELAKRRVELRDARLHRPAETVDRVKLRYRSEPVPCRVEHGDALSLRLGEEVHGVAPGQTACLLRGDSVVGWGTIGG
jgi:tRNA-uridine 2-sulfurtransferase